MTGSFSAVGVSANIIAKPNNSLSIVLAPAAGETFNGVVILEKSLTFGASWEQATDDAGAPIEWDGTSVSIDETNPEYIAYNRTPNSRAIFRLRCTDAGDEDAIAYEITQRDGDIVGVILRDDQQKPIMSRRDDGGIVLHAPLVLEGDGILEKVVTISAANIVGTAAGQFGHAAGYVLVPDSEVGAKQICELQSAVLISDRATAAYTDGGDITVDETGGAALTGVISAANSLGAATDKVATFLPLTTAAIVRTLAKGLSLVAAAAFTNPGTAAGVVRVRVRYRLVNTGL